MLLLIFVLLYLLFFFILYLLTQKHYEVSIFLLMSLFTSPNILHFFVVTVRIFQHLFYFFINYSSNSILSPVVITSQNEISPSFIYDSDRIKLLHSVFAKRFLCLFSLLLYFFHISSVLWFSPLLKSPPVLFSFFLLSFHFVPSHN